MKKLFVLLFVVGLLFTMSACSEDDNGDMDIRSLLLDTPVLDVNIAAFGEHYYRFTVEASGAYGIELSFLETDCLFALYYYVSNNQDDYDWVNDMILGKNDSNTNGDEYGIITLDPGEYLLFVGNLDETTPGAYDLEVHAVM